MKEGTRYVIEVDKVFISRTLSNVSELARIKGFNSLVFDVNGLSKLEKLEDVIQEECDRARQEGLNDGIKIGCREYHDGCVGCEYELFDGYPCTTCKGSYVDKYKPKGEKADEIKVGDEVKDFYYDHGAKGVVTQEKDGKVYIVWSDGSYGWRKKESTEIEKTGKQYPYIAEVLEQLNNE